MASARKPYVRTKPEHVLAPRTEQAESACFMADLLGGTIQATTVVDVRDGQGRLIRIDYDDPDGGPGAGKGGAGTRTNDESPPR